MAHFSRLMRGVVALAMLATLGIALFLILQSQIAQSSAPGTPREFTVNNDGVTCPHTVTFQGKTLNLDASTTWSYLVENKNGSGCGTSHWVLQMCQASPSVYGAFVKANPGGILTGKSGDPTTGIVGVKWNDIQSGYTDPPGGKFTLRLNQDFAIAKNVPLAIKVGEVTDGVIYGNIEGPDCQVGPGEEPSPTPTDTPVTPTDTPTPTYTDTPVTPPTITPTYTPTRTSTPTDTATPTNTPEIPLGGIGAYPDSGGLSLETADPSGGGGALLAVVLMAGGTAVAIALGGAAWYARRRR